MRDDLKEALKGILSEIKKEQILIQSIYPVSGGCINESFHMKTSAGDFFIKWNYNARFPGMFEAEARGLMLLKKSKTIYIPEVIVQNEFEGISFIILEWIESTSREKAFWSEFGQSLARLHQHTDKTFGLDHNNYIGSLPQSNKQQQLWTEFFIEERLKPQINLALRSNCMDHSDADRFEKLFHRLAELIPEEKPSLLHGDLWNGNFLVNQNGKAALIDPSVYFGHREMDLAMTKLFGGFDEEFYSSYQNTFPLQPGFHQRADLHNLYPLLVHLNLFGGGYLGQIKSILNYYE